MDHLRARDSVLTEHLNAGEVLTHPFVIGELALGNLRDRDVVLNALQSLPQAKVATEREVLHFIERQALFGSGIGYVDTHLLAAVLLDADAVLWTRHKKLSSVASRLGVAAKP